MRTWKKAAGSDNEGWVEESEVAHLEHGRLDPHKSSSSRTFLSVLTVANNMQSTCCCVSGTVMQMFHTVPYWYVRNSIYFVLLYLLSSIVTNSLSSSSLSPRLRHQLFITNANLNTFTTASIIISSYHPSFLLSALNLQTQLSGVGDDNPCNAY